MKLYVAFFCIMFLPTLLYSQAEINKSANCRAQAGVTSSTAYNFKIIDGVTTNDSLISVKRKFNKSGYRTETAIYKDGVLDKKYEFDYLSDTMISGKRYYDTKNNQINLLAESKYKYKNNRISKLYDVFTSSKYKGKEEYKYNKNGLLKREVLKFKRKKVKDNRYKYGENGKISIKTSHVPAKEKFIYAYDDEDRLLNIHKEFSDGSLKLVKYYDYSITDSTTTRHILNQSTNIIGINGRTKLWRTDVLTTIRTFDKNCQIIEEKEYLNGELNGFRKYHHTYSK